MINTVTYPVKFSEFEVQAEIYQMIKNEGIDIRGNVPSWCEDFGVRHKVFFDLVLFDSSQIPTVIIECKNSDIAFEKRIGSRQERRYNYFGGPLLICMNMEQVKGTISNAMEIHDSFLRFDRAVLK